MRRLVEFSFDYLAGNSDFVSPVADENAQNARHLQHSPSVEETIAVDLLDPHHVATLPKAPNVVLMTGFKFGTSEARSRTWATNTLLASLVAANLSGGRLVAFSTGCIYPFVTAASGGSVESIALTPPGEYANSCVGHTH